MNLSHDSDFPSEKWRLGRKRGWEGGAGGVELRGWRIVGCMNNIGRGILGNCWLFGGNLLGGFFRVDWVLCRDFR
ncbi:unnamed protein product [Moneuplotes crassus]|uniref:Uncharacterized protein n=1 Tax=Euplotes crassus TaxID=5936 RepID=A0AAD2DAJ1_EUPCR|nr:unnamed protein product [Moneuplotes crassus]